MRIHRLIIEGIGPYADRQELDFDELTANGLFLLSGPTGAGKTTILDAIVFALYGTVPGARGADGKREKGARERIVSDLRDIETKPLVELEFSAAGRRFIVRRSPDHDRPKTRGTGTTLAKASASLEERIHGDWVPRSTDFREVSIELHDVIGMNAEQFTQVVLLPQGEFAGFLRASVADRRKVLERLFQVDRYQSAEDWFRARAEVAKSTLADARADLELVVERLAGALGEAAGPEDIRRGLSGADEIAGWVAARSVDAEARVLTAEREATLRKSEHAAIDDAHVRAAQLADLEDALKVREAELAKHAARLPKAREWMGAAIDAATARDDQAWEPAARAARGRAAELAGRVSDERRLPLLARDAVAADADADTAARAAELADAAADEAQRAIVEARAAAEAGARAEATADGLRRDLADARHRIEAGQARDQLEVQLATAVERLAAATTTADAAQAALASLDSDADLDAHSRDLQVRRADLGQARAQLEAEVRQAITELDQVARDRAALAALSSEHETLASRARTANDAYLGARAAYLTAREARLDAMAAELATGLEPGEACPVCGSSDHPSPAPSGGAGDLRAAEAAAEATAVDLEREYAAAKQALDTCVGRLAAFDAAEIDARAGAVEAKAASRRAALGQLSAEDQAQGADARRLQQAVDARRRAVSAVEQARAASAAGERDVATIRERLTAARDRAGDGPLPTATDLQRLELELQAVQAQAATAAAARDRIVALEAEVERQRGLSGEQRAKVAAQRQAARGLRDQATQLTAELAAFRGAFPSVEAAANAASEHARILEAAAHVLDQHRTALLERESVSRQLSELAERDAAAGILLDDAPTDPHERVRYRAARRIESAELATNAAAQRLEALRCQAAITEAEASLDRALQALGPAAEAAERLIRLDATVRGGGDNLRKISLATYVLAARLEEVAAAATGHLLRMSSGRYELLHHDDRYGGGPAGLGLRVRDGWTGEERDTATLSGGEAFYASLALALGLAEVVTNESGGRPLDTLLVDEGFGSLDADTLEEVLGELDQLRAAGRSIGLVSHVPALAERIPAQLRVTPGRAGSTATVVIGAPV